MLNVGECVIFDLDGVLIDSRDAHFESWQQLAREQAVAVTNEQFASTFGRQNRDIIPLLFGERLSVARIEELGELKERYYREIAADRIRPVPGAPDLVRACRMAGMRCAVGSSGHPLNVSLALRALDIDSLMDAVVTGKDVNKGKPDPQVFLLAAERVGAKPSRCAVIEDAPAGIDAALAAGMIAIAITTEHPSTAFGRAHHVVQRPADLSPAIISELIVRGRLQ